MVDYNRHACQLVAVFDAVAALAALRTASLHHMSVCVLGVYECVLSVGSIKV